jgi:phospholipid/cholesterol/gamma-HCH transport system substrate-binding protein
MGIVITALVIGVGQSFTTVPMLFAQPVYYGEFAESGGLSKGDKVRIAGMDVGTVRSLELDVDRVVVGFDLGGTIVGSDSRMAIQTDTLLGQKVIQIEPRGSTPLRVNEVIPLNHTATPYQIYDAIDDTTKAASGWDIDAIKESLDVVSDTIDQASPHLSAALDGVERFSDTIAKRNEDLKALLKDANAVARVFGDRSEKINQILVRSNSLLADVNARGQAVDQLLERVSAVAVQVRGLVNDNPNLNNVLKQVGTVSDILEKHKHDLAELLVTIRNFSAALSEAVGSGPYFKAMLVNLLPGSILQPFIDSAFKERGIDPQKFWGDAGLPAFQFPDPNGERLPNGAPPPAPPVQEGTPEFPHAAVPPGSPCSYTPAPGAQPIPGNPLPCAALNQGPFGPVPGGYGPPNVLSSPANPTGPLPGPGLPAAALPGQPAPPVPGTPVPIPPATNPGATTVPHRQTTAGG